MGLVARVRRTLRERALIPRASLVVCACSGGPDSAALLACLARLRAELGFELLAASVNHGLRPEAAADVALAAEQAARCGTPFRALGIQVAPGAGLQARAREQRYAALLELAHDLGAQRVAVGHTQDDQAETVLARLLRGAGIQGLRAIRPARADGVVRPLIDARRAEVHQFARECFERVADDRSNADPRFERVRIRSHVVPVLEREDQALIRHLAQLADDARECTALVDQLADDLLLRALSDTGTLDGSVLVSQPAALRKATLRRFVDRVAGLRVGRAELLQLDQIIRSNHGEVWLSGGLSIDVSAAGRLCVRKRSGGSGYGG